MYTLLALDYLPPPPPLTHTHTHTHLLSDAPDVFAVSIDLVDVPVGIGTLNISCTLDALPPITEVTWSLNTTLIDPNSDPRITITTTNTATNLIIVGVEANEGGTYECTATNLVGTNSAETNVRIQCERVHVKVCVLCACLYTVCTPTIHDHVCNMYVCVYVCVCVCVCTCVCLYLCMYIYVCMYVCYVSHVSVSDYMYML